MMLQHLGELEKASQIERALQAVLAEGKVLTRDLKGNAGTFDFAEAIISKLKHA